MGDTSNCSLSVQLVLLIISIILFVIYSEHLFKDEGYNKLALAFSIVIFLWLISIGFRRMYYKMGYGWNAESCLFDISQDFKCAIGDSKCEDGNITYWTVL